MARSDNDPVPEFENPADALAWMNSKLDGSWVDQAVKPQKVAEHEREELLKKEHLSVEDFNKLMGF